MKKFRIPLHKPYWGKKEENAVLSSLRHTIGSGDGPNSDHMSDMLRTIVGVRHAFPVTSCTHAMELALASVHLTRGDEVIVPSFTMSSTANAVVLAGATPVFADIDPATYTIDPADIERIITKRTRGIMVVHYAGMSADMATILSIAKRAKLFVIEDAAHAIGASYYGKMLGSLGTAGAFSFHGTKNISCGEGGALVTNDDSLVVDIDIYRANGTNRHAFLSGKVSKYEWVGPGTSFFLSDILASVVCSQLNQLTTITNKRYKIASYYLKHFQKYERVVQLPVVPAGTFPNWHIFALKFKTEAKRKLFQSSMREAGIEVSTHYVPLHSAPMGRRLGRNMRDLPVTDDVSSTLVRLPIYPGLTEEQKHTVVSIASHALERM